MVDALDHIVTYTAWSEQAGHSKTLRAAARAELGFKIHFMAASCYSCSFDLALRAY